MKKASNLIGFFLVLKGYMTIDQKSFCQTAVGQKVGKAASIRK
jgi:hypothetical protein